jgi:hypothetical protein
VKRWWYFRLWSKLRQKDRVDALRAALASVGEAAGYEQWIANSPAYPDEHLTETAITVVRHVRRELDSLVKTLPSAPEALHDPFEVTHMILVGSDKTGSLVMGSARINGAGEFSSHNMGVQEFLVSPDSLPYGSRSRIKPVLRIPVVEHFIRLKIRDYTLVRGVRQHQALADLLANEPGLADAIGPAQPRISQV